MRLGIGINIGRRRGGGVAAPSGLVATVTAVDAVALTFTGTGDVERSTNGTDYTIIATDQTDSYSDTGLTAGTLYYHRIHNAGGYSNVVGNTISSLLTDLVFSQKWDGSQFINAVTGLAMTNTNSVATSTAIFTNSALPGVFVSASSKSLSTPDTAALSMGDIDFMIAVWCNITDVTLTQNICGQYNATGDQRSWRLAVVASAFRFGISSAGTAATFSDAVSGAITSNTNYLVLCWYNKTTDLIYIQVNIGAIYTIAHTGGAFNSTADLTIGVVAGSAYAGGKVNVDIWKKLLSPEELATLWDIGTGSKYPFWDYSFSFPYKVILMGDKSAGEDLTKSTTWNNVAMTRGARAVIGGGDYDGVALTTTQLMTNLSIVKFADPGNHDDWVVGVRTEFNANFNGGGYRKVSFPGVDFFIYDPYLKMDESGIYTNVEAEAITLAARQASTQGQWLINALAASTARFKIVITHQPAWASTSDDEVAHGVVGMPAMRWDWAAYGVDLLLHGHFHFYERLLKNTGSGNVPVLVLGVAGAGDLGWVDVEPDSQVRITDATDAEFNLPGYLIEMTVNATNLQIDLSGVDSAGVVHAGKDQLILT